MKLKLEFDINLALKWYNSNDLVVNTNKTKFLILDTCSKFPKNLKIKIENDYIDPSPSLKYLGCTLDRHLKFDNHIKLLCYKASRKVNLMNHIMKLIKPSSILFYKSFIRPLLESTPALLFAISKYD